MKTLDIFMLSLVLIAIGMVIGQSIEKFMWKEKIKRGLPVLCEEFINESNI